MLKQLLTGASVIALVLAGSFTAQAKPKEPILRSQAQDAPSTLPAPDGSTTPPESGTSPDSGGSMTAPGTDGSMTAPESGTSPDSGGSMTAPESGTSPDPGGSMAAPESDSSPTSPDNASNASVCTSNFPASPSGGGTRQRLDCNQN